MRADWTGIAVPVSLDMTVDSLPTNPSDRFLPALLFALFALLAAGGGFWIVASQRSRRAGWMTGLAILAFFAVLFFGMKELLGSGAVP